jgi:chromosome partitioning protein
MEKHNIVLPCPSHFVINRSRADSGGNARDDEYNRFISCIGKAIKKSDFVLIDAPGNDTYLSRLSHSFANTIITPINDSFIDLAVLAKVNDETLEVDVPGIYSEMIWEAKLHRAKRNRGEIDWIVMRNRLTNINASNKHRMAEAMKNLSRRLGCVVGEGFGERVIYRELYLKGLSLLDMTHPGIDMPMKMSHLAARSELRRFMENITSTRNLQRYIAYLEKQKEELAAKDNAATAAASAAAESSASVHASLRAQAAEHAVTPNLQPTLPREQQPIHSAAPTAASSPALAPAE